MRKKLVPHHPAPIFRLMACARFLVPYAFQEGKLDVQKMVCSSFVHCRKEKEKKRSGLVAT
jgi:hypothetical protein